MKTNLFAGMLPQAPPQPSLLFNQPNQAPPIFDYNLQIKLYQMYLQNLMTANLIQNLRNANANAAINNQFDNSNNDSDHLNRSNESFNDNDDDEKNDGDANNRFLRKSHVQQPKSSSKHT